MKPRSIMSLGGAATPASVFYNRRQILERLGLAALGLVIAPCSKPPEDPGNSQVSVPDGLFPAARNPDHQLPTTLDSLAVTDQDVVAHHNNFYEFLPGKGGDVAPWAADFEVTPWQLTVRGACHRPRTFSLEDLFAFPHEERLYHFRCVERWSMNVPWTGFPLRRFLDLVEPTSEARWVTFESAANPVTMPGITATPHYPWPYHEALRLDEAEHDLALLATGIYGAPLPKQHGAPIRLVVPWKYGYKSAKSLVAIEFHEQQPTTFWSEFSPHEYGLLSNVNPNIPHPRWSQEQSFWLRDDPVWPTGDDSFATALFNGYEDQVAGLYADEPRTLQRPLRPGEVAR